MHNEIGLSFEEVKDLLKNGLGIALQQTAAQYTVPICWVRAHEGKPIIADNGSAFLLDAGRGAF